MVLWFIAKSFGTLLLMGITFNIFAGMKSLFVQLESETWLGEVQEKHVADTNSSIFFISFLIIRMLYFVGSCSSRRVLWYVMKST